MDNLKNTVPPSSKSDIKWKNFSPCLILMVWWKRYKITKNKMTPPLLLIKAELHQKKVMATVGTKGLKLNFNRLGTGKLETRNYSCLLK